MFLDHYIFVSKTLAQNKYKKSQKTICKNSYREQLQKLENTKTQNM